jgi:phage tail-like protein
VKVLDQPPTHVLLGERVGWRTPHLDRVEERDGTLRLRRLPGSARPLVDADGSFGGLALPRSIAVDADDAVYVLDAAACVVKRFDPCEQRFDTLPCLGGDGSEPRQLHDPHGIAISYGGDLYVADTGNARVQVLSLKGLALRRIIAVDETWRPWDVAIGPDERLYVSDREGGTIRVFCDGETENVWPHEGTLDHPTDLALDRDGKLYVVEDGHGAVAVLEAGRVLERIERPDELEGRFTPYAVGIDPDGTLYVGERYAGRLHLFEEETCVGSCATEGSSVLALAFDRAGNPLFIDGKRVFALERQAAFEPEGFVYLGPLDSSVYRCEWHRVLLDASVPRGTAIRVDTLTSESEKSFAEVVSLDERWATRQIHAQVDVKDWDCLVQSPPGRFLWLRLRLQGGTGTPLIRRAKVYLPRASSLQFLPAVYSEDPESRDFSARFLSIFDTIRGSVSGRADDIAALFDPRATPSTFLSWLGSWLGLALDRALPEHRRRELVRRAHELYTWRGTPRGVRLQVELYTGVEPLLLEHFKLRRWLFVGDARLGDTSALWGDAIVRRLQLDRFSRIGEFQLIDSDDPLHDPFSTLAHQFTVFVPVHGAREVSAARLEQIVALAKPAHTQAYVQVVDPRFRIGTHSFVGLDTVVGSYPDAVVEGEARLGYDAVLGPSADEARPPRLRVGVRSRIGSSTLID